MREKKLFFIIFCLVAIILFVLKYTTQQSYSCNEITCPFPSDFPCPSGNCTFSPFPSCVPTGSPSCSPQPSSSPRPTISPLPTPSETPDVSPTYLPSPSTTSVPEISPTPTPQPEVTPTPTPNDENNNGNGGTGGGGESSSSNNQPSGQVLGGQVLAATGNSTQELGISLIIFGTSAMISSAYAIRKTKKLS